MNTLKALFEELAKFWSLKISLSLYLVQSVNHSEMSTLELPKIEAKTFLINPCD